jgi:hypothetical protein
MSGFTAAKRWHADVLLSSHKVAPFVPKTKL